MGATPLLSNSMLYFGKIEPCVWNLALPKCLPASIEQDNLFLFECCLDSILKPWLEALFLSWQLLDYSRPFPFWLLHLGPPQVQVPDWRQPPWMCKIIQTGQAAEIPQNLVNSTLLAILKLAPTAPACCYRSSVQPALWAHNYSLLCLSYKYQRVLCFIYPSVTVLCPSIKITLKFYKIHSQHTTLWFLSRLQEKFLVSRYTGWLYTPPAGVSLESFTLILTFH